MTQRITVVPAAGRAVPDPQAGLEQLEGVDTNFDLIDSMVDHNIAPIGPDGRIEARTREDYPS